MSKSSSRALIRAICRRCPDKHISTARSRGIKSDIPIYIISRESALEIVDDHPVDLGLFDMQMRVVTGLDVIRHIKSELPAEVAVVPCILITASYTADLLREAEAAHASAVRPVGLPAARKRFGVLRVTRCDSTCYRSPPPRMQSVGRREVRSPEYSCPTDFTGQFPRFGRICPEPFPALTRVFAMSPVGPASRGIPGGIQISLDRSRLSV